MTKSTGSREGFDTGAAVTRSLLGWGVVVGPFYLVIGLALALTRPGFDLSQHPLSLLMLGDGGWMQSTNLVLSGLMVLAAAVGFHRALGNVTVGVLLGVYGLGLLGSATFPPDPMAGFPANEAEIASTSGILHLTFGLIQFVALTAATFVVAGWFARRGSAGIALYSRVSGALVLGGFVGGAALATSSIGVGLLWLAVVAGWGWLLVASVHAYRTVPHPDAHRRASPTPRPPTRFTSP